jgi:hypothetical protein
MIPSQPAQSSIDRRHAATDRATYVTIGMRRFVGIDGIGAPTSDDFRFALDPLRRAEERTRHRLAGRLSVEDRRELHPAVPECIWWHPDVALPADLLRAIDDRAGWHWRQLVELPARATDEEATEAIDDAARTAGRARPLVRLVRLTEGPAAQILHRGGSATIAGSLRRLYDELAASGTVPGRTIHEVRVADERLVPPDRAHLILRVPIEVSGPATPGA